MIYNSIAISKRFIFHSLIQSNLVIKILAYICAKQTDVIEGPGNNMNFNILALNHARFRGDLQVLVNSGDIRIFLCPWNWQSRFCFLFYKPHSRIETKDQTADDIKRKKALRSFLGKFLHYYYQRLEIGMVIGAAVHYRQDVDWGAVSQSIGIPYLVLHKEGLHACRGSERYNIKFHSELTPFEGAQVFVHNNLVRSVWLQSGYIQSDQISVIGRIDTVSFLQRLGETGDRNSINKESKLITLFSFWSGLGNKVSQNMDHWGSQSLNFKEIFDKTHVRFCKLALKMPHWRFVIKPKWGGEWYEKIDDSLSTAGITTKAIPNLTIDAKIDPVQLIIDSDVVVGFNSTVILEAAIANKPVVVPYFSDSLSKEHSDWIRFYEDDIFCNARSEDELEDLILKCVETPEIDEAVRARRRELFSKYISPIEGSALVRCREKLVEIYETGRPSYRTEFQ
jgi:hypothetical protein